MSHRPRIISTLALIAVCLFLATSAPGQETLERRQETLLNVEILTPQIGGNPLNSQRWHEVFRELDVGVRIRPPLGRDKPEIKESTRGNFRIVSIVGRMDREGKVTFPGKTFTIGDTDVLKEWLDEFRTYGAQGAPEGKPRWGLTEAQFEQVFEQLSRPVEGPLRGLELRDAVARVPLPDGLKVVFHSDAEALLKVKGTGTLAIEVEGLSGGTALAAVLAQWKLGFRPLRDPKGGVRLVVEPLEKISDPWQIGWSVDEVTPRNQIVPKLFEMVMTGFDEVPLSEVLDAVQERTGVTILINRAFCLEREIDVDQVRVSYPRKRTAWALVVQSTVRQVRLNYEFRLDEADRPFVYVYPFVPYVPESR
jgi:hypothetical protein